MPDQEDEFTKDFNIRYSLEREENRKLYTKGFNAGYQLSKHEPELLDRILKSPNEDKLYLNAMQYGKKQHEKDKVLAEIRLTKEQSKDKERER